MVYQAATSSRSVLAALDLAGWVPLKPERCAALDALHVENTRIPMCRPSANRLCDVVPRPAVRAGLNRLRDVYGDTFTLGAATQRGAFGVFKMGTQMVRPEPRIFGVKAIDLRRDPALGGPTMTDVRRECGIMAQVGSALSPYAVRYTYALHRPLRPQKPTLVPRDALVFMPLAAGGDVLELANAFIDGALPMLGLFARHVLVCVAAQLEEVHAGGVAHGDVKIENLFVGCDGAVYLGDFGLASRRGTKDAKAMGSFAFAAPEQFEPSYDERADVYSLAVCIVSILGTNPLDFGTACDLHVMLSSARCRRRMLAQWIQQERTGLPANIAPDDLPHWEKVRVAMDLAKDMEPRLMPLLMTMLTTDAAARPSVRDIRETLRQQNLNLAPKERGKLARTMLTLPVASTRLDARSAAARAAMR